MQIVSTAAATVLANDAATWPIMFNPILIEGVAYQPCCSPDGATGEFPLDAIPVNEADGGPAVLCLFPASHLGRP